MAVAIRANHQAYAGDEQQLVAAVRRGDDNAFGVLYERYRPRIGAYVGSMISDHGRSEDVAQEVFISALRRLRATDQPVMFKPWLYEIAKNACIDEYRRTRRTHEVPLETDAEVSEIGKLHSPTPTPHAAVETKMRLDDLRGAFRGLSDSHHRILVLRELEGLSYNQIGDRMGLSKPVVESTLFRARRRLGEEFAELESGRRCARVQDLIESVAEGQRSSPSLGLRERRLLSRHLSHCAPCLRQARVAGIDDFGLAAKKPGKLAIGALLPIPAWLRLRRSGHSALTGHASSAVQAVQSIAPAASSGSPLSGLGRAAAAAFLAIAGAGGGLVATNSIGGITPTAPGRVVLSSGPFGTRSVGVLGASGVANGAVSGVVVASRTGATTALLSAAGVAAEQKQVALVDQIVTLVPTLVTQGSTASMLLSSTPASPATQVVGTPPLLPVPKDGVGAAIGGAAASSGGSLLETIGAPLAAPIVKTPSAPVTTPIAPSHPVLGLGAAAIKHPVSAPTVPVTGTPTLPVLGSDPVGTLNSTTQNLLSGVVGTASSATAAATGALQGVAGGGSIGAGAAGTGSNDAGSSASTNPSDSRSATPVRSLVGAATTAIAPAAASTVANVISGASSTAGAATTAASSAAATATGVASAATGAASTATTALSSASGALSSATGALSSATSALTQSH